MSSDHMRNFKMKSDAKSDEPPLAASLHCVFLLTMSLSYEAALSTLQSMFADQGYTSALFDAVLRHQGGHMENTVEILLLHA